MSPEVFHRAYLDTLGRSSGNVGFDFLHFENVLELNGSQCNVVPEVIVGVLWVGTLVLRKRSVLLLQDTRMVYVIVPRTIPRQI